MRVRFAVILSAILATSVAVLDTQTPPHYCDTIQPTAATVLVSTQVTLTVCQSNKDTNGNPTTLTGWALYDNTIRMTPTMTAGSTSPVSGLQMFTFTFFSSSTQSTHTYQMAALNAQGGEGPKSDPFCFDSRSRGNGPCKAGPPKR